MDFLQRFSEMIMGPTAPYGTPCGRQVQIMSDLHLEVNNQYDTFDFAVKAPLLVLGGDIGRLVDYEPLLKFLARQTARFDKVFLVLGNHEFFGMTYSTGIRRATRLEKEEVLGGKLVLLNRNRWDDETSRLTILGCTLWSDIPPAAEDDVKLRVSDFKMIRGWSVDYHNDCHIMDSTWLKKTLNDMDVLEPTQEERQVLIVTHHAPCFKGTSRPEHEKNPWKVAYATDVMQRPEYAHVSWWMYGHTHFTTQFQRGSIRVVANQRGYVLGTDGPPLEDANEFDAEKVLDL
ncbi:hypothetical protein G7Z17_g4138 [Cylindrodendrum hubeiense]|uniref:Calcineurin-like phosphoesterase domain-containing protein n=1 Tax=Cylindrodendrum hubeiense TaxID=595255 RepID=A0A9P5LIN2_9HYPO|nr:hypothetical protein G7Z17_g4138 [Cylindrodendrum hubeiense]